MALDLHRSTAMRWLLVFAIGCGSDPGGVDAGARGHDAARSDGGALPDASRDGPTDAGREEIGLALELVDRELVCKLISGDELLFESENHTHTRYNLRGTDLGTPAIVGDELHLFFGDTHGYRRIWRVGEDPDSVARVSLSAARADLRVLCTDLRFYVTPDVPSVAAGEDPRIERDFEGGYLGPPPGRSIREFIDRPALESEAGAFAGSFEVPSGALTHDGRTYVLWSARPGTGEIGPMRLSFLARWETAGSSPLFYRILHPIDDLFETRPLGGHFLQNAAIVRDGTLYLFGTGVYRTDGVHLARKPASAIETEGGFELYDPRSSSWTPAASLTLEQRGSIPAVVDEDVRGIGELGVIYVEDAGLYVMMYQQLSATSAGNRMEMLVARRPEGPWASATIILMEDPAFRSRHCCMPAGDCPGERIIHCEDAGLYAIYPLPLVETSFDGDAIELVVPFVASTWQPYNTVLFRARVRVEPRFDG
jgi:hypothetical protein